MSLLAACANQQSKPLNFTEDPQKKTITWSASELPITTCQANRVEKLEFSLWQTGHWESNITIQNTDGVKYRQNWHNSLNLLFNQGIEGIASLKLLDETMPAGQRQNYQNSGESQKAAQTFKQLKTATVSLSHECKGIKG